jgi:ABC-type branched-subunit amino acid transport system substrate-binding protein
MVSSLSPLSDLPRSRRRPRKSGRRSERVASALAILFLIFMIGNRQARADGSDSSAEIVLGMSTALTGSVGNLGQGMQRGIVAGLERANRNGGVNGRKLRLISLDDEYEPTRTAVNVRQLTEKDRVLAIIGDVGTSTAIVAVPMANDQKTLFFAPFSGGTILRKVPPDRYVINFRASYAEETAAMVDALIDVGGLKPEEIAFFTQRDTFGDDGFVLGLTALEHHGLKDPKRILGVRYQRNTLAVEGAVANLLMADKPPRAVVMVGACAPCAKFIRLCRDADLNPIFLGISFVDSKSLADAMGTTDAHIIVTQVVPDPSDESFPMVGEYQADLKAMDPSADAGFVDFEGYIAARILTLALERIEGAITREGVVDALDGLGKFDLGLGVTLCLGRREHQASHQVWPTLLKKGRFVPFQWSEIRALSQGEKPQ